MASFILGIISICSAGIIQITGDLGLFYQPTGIEGEYMAYGAGVLTPIGIITALVSIILGVIQCIKGKKGDGQKPAVRVYIGMALSVIALLLIILKARSMMGL